MRPEPHELDPSNYPYHIELQTRFGDMDVLRHLNNVSITQLFEEGRFRFALDAINQSTEEQKDQNPMVTVSVLTNYLNEVFYPAPVIVSIGMYHFGKSSYSMSCLMQQEGKNVAHSRASLVCSQQGKAQPLAPEVIERLRAFMLTIR